MIANPEDASLLEIIGFTVSHGSETLLSDVSFSVRRGTLHALVGANGAGKTTLLSAILGQTPFSGRTGPTPAGSGTCRRSSTSIARCR